MNTPIIDSLWEKTKGIREYHAALEETAKKLEADRAELLTFLAQLDEMADDEDFGSSDFRKVCRYDIPKAIAKVKANFPAAGS